MARVTVEDSVEAVEGNRFALVMMATKRVRQLMSGATPRVAHEKNKEPVTSLREIAAGMVRFDRSLRSALEGRYNAVEKPFTLRAARRERT